MSYEDNQIKKYNDRLIEDGIRRKEEEAEYLSRIFEKERRRKELDASFDIERQDREFTKDVSTNQFLLEQELQRIEKSKSKKYADLDSSIEELLKKYPSLDLKDFSQILQQQSSEQFIQQFSKEELEELIKIYLKGINNNGRRR